MNERINDKPEKRICVGLLAHVDAGKTTLAEGILYKSGVMRKLGRVDHGDTVLDNFELERSRGITIFSKQAQLVWNGLEISLLDTPGHVDFSAEMERTLKVLDIAVLIINGADGVQGHTQTLWSLLKRYEIPVFIFVNKMDQVGTDRDKLLSMLQSRLDAGCLEFGEDVLTKEEFRENISMCSEELLEEYLETGELSLRGLQKAIYERKFFPCYFGSALKLEGVDALLNDISKYAVSPGYGSEFAAKVFKIARDASGNRLTFLKVTGGSLRVKMPVSYEGTTEKTDQIRLYTGAQYQTTDAVHAGGICAVTGLTKTFAGQGLGAEKENSQPILEPVLTYRIELPEGSDAISVLGQLRLLEEEDPQLHIVWKEALSEIHVQVMGEVQIEILKSLISERFGLEVSFDSGNIVYKETIAEPVVGIGHFEPLRHYAEVHLLLEPGEQGSGLIFSSDCSEDVLDKNWQRLILTHLEERTHPGVLTGSEITDMKITLLTGRAHLKHTEGGDFRQATYRAVRQGLRKGKSVLLEPYFAFTLEVPSENIGRAMSDLKRMNGDFEAPVLFGEMSVLTGSAPVFCMQDYQREVNTYTRGRGRLSCNVKGYFPCHNAKEVVERFNYDCDGDTENPTGSVFCAHGAGFVVNWDEVDEYAHAENGWKPSEENSECAYFANDILDISDLNKEKHNQKGAVGRDYISQEEIEEIFKQSYRTGTEDNNRYRRYHKGVSRYTAGGESAGERNQTAGRADDLENKSIGSSQNAAGTAKSRRQQSLQKERYLLVDGYNIIFAWEDLKALAAVNIDSARDRLMDICSNYQGYLGDTLILVFDAYKVKGNPGSVLKYHNIYVVYTKEAETADQYIEKTVHQMGGKYHVTVATSDGLEQMIIWGDGAIRMSARGFREAIEEAGKELAEKYKL